MELAVRWVVKVPRGHCGDRVIKFPAPDNSAAGLPISLQETRQVLQYEAKVLSEATTSGIRNVVHLVADKTGEDLPFLVMERLKESLRDLMDGAEDGLELVVCLRMVHEVATGLEGLHQNDWCHYDVKPDNILRGSDGWTLIDPAPETYGDKEYQDRRFPRGAEREDVALGRTFLDAAGGTTEDRSGDVDQLLNRMTVEARKVPNATQVRRAAAKILREQFGESIPRRGAK